ncbi:MAG: hypothetical protein HY858_13050 [Candidatus Solibacter usitatus]|nr:hypothetical protein [Candidatus Solibacter usitatus]
MRPTASLSIAAVSLLLAAALPGAAARPRFGGTLRLSTRAVITTLDPAHQPVGPLALATKSSLAGHVFETLVKLDWRGDPQPHLATGWTHEPAQKRWVFAARPKVLFHNGARWEPAGSVIHMPDDRPIADILRELSHPRSAIVLRLPDGSLAGTGPFRLAQFEAGKAVTLAAFDNYWAGRPFLDSVELRMGRSLRDQALDLELGNADLAELSLADVRRARQRGARLAVSAPVEVLALAFDRARQFPEALRHALALALDRPAIQSVLLQKMGDASAVLLPQWLTGYAFVFPAARDLPAARLLTSSSPPLDFSYDRLDPLLRAVAERIILNAAEAGLTLKSSPGPAAVRLLALRVTSTDPVLALEDLAPMLGAPPAQKADAFDRERAALEAFYLIPIVHLPACYELGPRVQGWIGAPWVASGRWDLAAVWLAEDRP